MKFPKKQEIGSTAANPNQSDPRAINSKEVGSEVVEEEEEEEEEGEEAKEEVVVGRNKPVVAVLVLVLVGRVSG